MTEEKNIPNQTNHIVDLMVDDVLEASDEDILQEASEENVDVKACTQKVHTLIQEAVFEHNKFKLEEAKRQVQENKTQNKERLSIVGIERKREIFRNLSSNDNEGSFTMAARKEEDLSDHDIESALQDMLELGVIDEDGNIL